MTKWTKIAKQTWEWSAPSGRVWTIQFAGAEDPRKRGGRQGRVWAIDWSDRGERPRMYQPTLSDAKQTASAQEG